jgi:hypothetical protein
MRKMVPQGTPRGRALCHCGERVQGQGLCKKHYQMARRDGTIKIIQPHHRMRRAPLTEGGLTRDELRDDMSGPRCRCGLRLPCNDCLPRTLGEFIRQRMQAPSNWITGPRTGEE